MSIISENTNNEVRIEIWEMIFDRNNSIEYEFKIGQKVKTIIGENVNTERVGIIINKSFYDKYKTTIYQILINGKSWINDICQ